ncbi:hypothetical protein Ssi03_31670 [Sphaerisporangium siamense]|nr:hypothetical protein Ssi03_31670 [Sphaerisporangium siamense]
MYQSGSAAGASGYRPAYWHAALACAGVAALALLTSLLGTHGRTSRPPAVTQAGTPAPGSRLSPLDGNR